MMFSGLPQTVENHVFGCLSSIQRFLKEAFETADNVHCPRKAYRYSHKTMNDVLWFAPNSRKPRFRLFVINTTLPEGSV
jgi:hypothetical protein